MEKVICYTSSSSENGNKVYNNLNNGKRDKVEYCYKNATDLLFLIIENKKSNDRSLVLMEKASDDNNSLSTKYGYNMKLIFNYNMDTDSINIEKLDTNIDVLEHFPFEDIDDISCGRHYKEEEVEQIFNVMNSLVACGYGEQPLTYVKGNVLRKSYNN